MMGSKEKNKVIYTPLTSTRKKVYLIFTFLLPFIFFAFLEIGLRITSYGGSIPLFVSLPDDNSPYYGINLEIAKRYFRNLPDVPTPRKDLFLKEKPENGYRIFVLGESAAAGFPYGNNITFPRILARRLSDIFPEKRIEVINVALTAINSYALLDFMDEILQQKPDAILLYAGNNEYYGALGISSVENLGKHRWMVKIALKLQKFKTYLLLRNIMVKIKTAIGGKNIYSEKPSATLMERIVRDKIIPLNSNDYKLGLYQFQENIREIIEKAHKAGVKIVLSELVSNIRDNKPFISIEDRNLPSAQSVYEKAIELESKGNYEEARKQFYLAKDLDALRFRAPEDLNIVIHNLGREYNIPVVPMKDYFESNSSHRLIGNNLMLEHLHPNIDGYFLMAEAFLNTIRREKLVDTCWEKKGIKPLSYYRNNWGYTKLDSTYAAFTVMRLKSGWPFKETSTNLFRSNVKLTNKIDSVAIRILDGEITLEQAHIEMAKHYEELKDYKNAFNEYKALIYSVPYFDIFYEPAMRNLLAIKDYDNALNLLFDLLKYQETSTVYQWIGQIYLLSGNLKSGIYYLEKARRKEPFNTILLYNLGCAYFNDSQVLKGLEIIEQLKLESGNNELVFRLENLKNNVLHRRNQKFDKKTAK